jgi:hypothetical protein
MSGNWWTVLIGAVLTIAPQLIPTLPAPVQDIASALLAAAVAAWHLYQPVPAPTPPAPPASK